MPAKKVGGDYYDVLELSDERLGLAIADVSGKGVPAAILIASVRSALQAQCAREGLSVADILEHLNDMVFRDTANNKLIGSISHFSLIPPTTSGGSKPPTTPGTPTITAYQFGPGLTVSWSASSKINSNDPNIAGYEVYRSTSQTSGFSNISGDSFSTGSFNSGVLVTGTAYNDTTASDGVTYYYKAAAFNVSGDDSASSAASAGICAPRGFPGLCY